MGNEIVDGEVIEPEDNSKNNPSVRRRRSGFIPKSGTDATSQPADLDGRGSIDAASNTPSDRDISQLLKERADEFTRHYEALIWAYEKAMYGVVTDTLAVMHHLPVEEKLKAPLAARLASSCGEVLMQAGQRLVRAAESRPSWPVDEPTIIVFTNDGGQDDRTG